MGSCVDLLVEPRKPSFLNYSCERDFARAVIVGVPYDVGSTCKPGCRYAPLRIREASLDLETYDPILHLDAEDLPVSDLGDVAVALSPEAMLRDVAKVTRELRKEGKLVVGMGGDHTVTLGLLSGIEGPLSLIVFDAHLDFREEFPRGEKLSHATVLRRALEGLVKEAVVVGARALSKEEVNALKLDDRVAVVYSWAGRRELEDSLSVMSRPRYVSIDIDVLDPSVAPGVGCPEPGGLSYGQLVELLQQALEGGVLGLDLVEVNPLMDVNDITSRVAAKLLMKCLALLVGRG